MKLVVLATTFAAMMTGSCSDLGTTDGDTTGSALTSVNGCTKIPDRDVRRARLVTFGECPKGYEKLAPGEAERLAREAREARQRQEARSAESRDAALQLAQSNARLNATLEAMRVGAESAAAEAIARLLNQPTSHPEIAAENRACLNAAGAYGDYACRKVLARRKFVPEDIRFADFRIFANKGTRVICGLYRVSDAGDGSEERVFVMQGKYVVRHYRSRYGEGTYDGTLGQGNLSACKNDQAMDTDAVSRSAQVASTAISVPAQFYGKWAPSPRECEDVILRDGGTAIDRMPSETAIRVHRRGFDGFEAGSSITAAMSSPQGTYSFKARASAAEDERPETLTFKMLGSRMVLRRGGSPSVSYVRCT